MKLSMVEMTENKDVLQQLVDLYAKSKKTFIKLESKPDPWGGEMSIFSMKASGLTNEENEAILQDLDNYLREYHFDRGQIHPN